MKKNTHPTYYPNAVIKCVCGNKMTVGSTKKETGIEICANCHPFFTGKKKIMDMAGRVEKFKARAAAKQTTKPKAKNTRSKTTVKKKK